MHEPNNTGTVQEINGPIVTIRLPGIRNGEQVRIGRLGLYGEVIGLQGDEALAQIYESTEMVRPGEPVESLGRPLSVELGPGLMGGIFDGVQRPLEKMYLEAGDQIPRGLSPAPLDREHLWYFVPSELLEPNMPIIGGARLGSVQETETLLHQILVPPEFQGELIEIAPEGQYTLDETIARVRMADGHVEKLQLYHRWPVRRPRPYQGRDHGVEPLITGQRILDTFFPMLKGGKCAVPGPFGAGKTVVQHQVARWANADIVIYVGCGERGNELVDV
ncbi:MAG: V-type ATP synthase subunit A, partial [Pseudomonadota bacterium]